MREIVRLSFLLKKEGREFLNLFRPIDLFIYLRHKKREQE